MNSCSLESRKVEYLFSSAVKKPKIIDVSRENILNFGLNLFKHFPEENRNFIFGIVRSELITMRFSTNVFEECFALCVAVSLYAYRKTCKMIKRHKNSKRDTARNARRNGENMKMHFIEKLIL